MTTAYFVDTYSRVLMLSTVNVTVDSEGGLILRYGAEIGPLVNMVVGQPFSGWYTDAPVLVSTAGYKARSSAGQVEVVGNGAFEGTVVAIQGFPWMKKGALRPLKEGGWEVRILPPRTSVSLVRGQHHAHSNQSTAAAAVVGLRLRAQVQRSLIVIEGQSDHIQGIEFNALRVWSGAERVLQPHSFEWEAEHNFGSAAWRSRNEKKGGQGDDVDDTVDDAVVAKRVYDPHDDEFCGSLNPLDDED